MNGKSLILLFMSAVLFDACTEELQLTPSDSEKSANTLNAAKKTGTTGPLVYTTGSPADVTTTTGFGIALIGGAESDTDAETAAFQFLVSKSGGGDFVVLRSSGADGYNDYVYSVIGGVNSVETIIVNSRALADHATTEALVRNAEAIFIAGGDQSDYVKYWKDTKLEAAINDVMNVKQVPIGGTSAGLAILGEYYFGALKASVTSAEALANPYTGKMAGLDGGGFLDVAFMSNIITDSHYGARERQGRHFTFMARLVQDFAVSYTDVKGIGIDEATSVIVESDGTSKIYGAGNAYFLKGFGGTPEVCASKNELTWNRNGQAVSAYVIAGSPSGLNTFNFNTWTGTGGSSQFWSANEGVFIMN